MSTTQATPPPGWHPDPWRRHELRYWDGTTWTGHVSTQGVQGHDNPTPVPVADHAPEQVQRQVHVQARAGGGPQGGGTVFTEPVLVVNQKAKFIEVTNEYAIHDQHGRQIGAVRQIGQSGGRELLRALTNVDAILTLNLEIVDVQGQVLLRITRPGTIWKSTVVVTDAHGAELGTIVQQNLVGRVRFGLESGGQQHGLLSAENWRAWNFKIEDHTGTEVARITKTFEGVLRSFTTADNYVVQIHRPLADPLRSLVIASALAVDTVLKQHGLTTG